MQTTPDGLIVEWVLPAFSLEEVLLEGTPYCRILVNRMGTTAEPGAPQLPAAGTWLGIPPETQVEVKVLDAEGETLQLPRPLQPAPQVRLPEPGPNDDPLAATADLIYHYAPDPAVYAGASTYPGDLVRIDEQGWIRSQKVALLRFYPFQYNPATKELQVYRRLRVQVLFQGPISQQLAADSESAPFESLFQATLLNADQARAWRSKVIPEDVSPGLPPGGPRPAIKVAVDHDALYRLDFAALRRAGVPVDEVDPRSFELHRGDNEVALWIPAEGGALVEHQDALFFYGQEAHSRYARTNVYWLTWGTEMGSRMPERSGYPAPDAPVLSSYQTTAHRETNGYYWSRTPGPEDMDRWLWIYLHTSIRPEFSFDLPATAPAAAFYTPTLRLNMQGAYNGYAPAHHVQAFLNGTYIGDGRWNDYSALLLELSFPRALLQEGNNIVRLAAPGDNGYFADLFFLDWAEVDYARTFTVTGDRLEFSLPDGGPWAARLEPFNTPEIVALDISDPLTPVRITKGIVEPVRTGGYRFQFRSNAGAGAHYLITALNQAEVPTRIELDRPADLRMPTNGADYLIIAHQDLIAAVLPLAQSYAEAGFRTKVVDVQDIYDEFGAGLLNPYAIHDFLVYAYTYWEPPAPTYVLLTGDGHYDFKNYLGDSPSNRIPPYLAYVDPWLGEATADNRYACLVGNDILADVFLGRLPVNTLEETSAVVDKILAYRRLSGTVGWQSRILLVADNADSDGNFAALSEQLANEHTPAPYVPDKVYLGVNYPYENPAENTRAAVIEALNQGRLILNYIGHGDVTVLTGEQLLRAQDVAGLANGAAQPLFLSWSCNTGRYSEPSLSNSAISEVFVRAPGNGVIAAWAATGLGMAWAHQYMNIGFLDALFQDDLRALGPAAMAGNLRLYNAAPYAGYHLDTAVLLGDPALEMALPAVDLDLSTTPAQPNPVPANQVVTLTLALANAGPATAHGVCLQTTLPTGWSLRSYTSRGVTLTLVTADPPAWRVQDLAAGQAGTISIQAQVGSAGGAFLVASVVHTTGRESNPNNNQALTEVQVLAIPVQIVVKIEAQIVPVAARHHLFVRGTVHIPFPIKVPRMIGR